MTQRIYKFIQRNLFNSKLRTRLFRKLVRFLGNSVPLIKALDILHYHASNGGKNPKNLQAVILNQWRSSVRDGKSFSQAIQGWVPECDRLVIEGGEKAGRLANAIDQAIEINQAMTQIKTAILIGLAYPAILTAAMIGFVILFGVEVIPEFDSILPREQWTGTGAHLALLSDFVIDWLSYTLVGITLIALLIAYSLSRWKGKIRAKFDNIPPWSFYRLIIGTGFLLTTAGMLKSGISIPFILSVLQRNASPYYRERLYQTAQNVKNGHNLGHSLQLTGLNFPDREMIQDIRIYADLNRFNETLENMGKEWLEDSKEKIQRQSVLIRNAAVIALGCVFMWIASGIFTLQQQIASAL